MRHLERKKLVAQQLNALPPANKPRPSDGSALFKLVGGKYHDIEIRAYAPWEPIEFPNGDRYVYHPHPVGNRSQRHVYMKEN